MDIPPAFGNAIYPVSYFLGYRKSHPKDEEDPLLVAKSVRSGSLMRKVEYWVHTLIAAYVGLILVGEIRLSSEQTERNGLMPRRGYRSDFEGEPVR